MTTINSVEKPRVQANLVMTLNRLQNSNSDLSRNAQVATNLRVGVNAFVLLQSGGFANDLRQILK